MEIYTIGHSNYTIERLIDMLNRHKINCVVDIRGIPYSKYNIQFDLETIKYLLNKSGFIYIYMGKEFGANRMSRISYNDEGYADFEKVIKEDEFSNGIERLENGLKKGYKIALLGAMQDPIRCHRSILVGRTLRDYGFNVKHIIDDYSTKSQKDIEESLLDKYFQNRRQISIESILGNEMKEIDMIIKAYEIANKEIGYRVENLK
ncbi:DUF488 domain-containing protein [Clostridium sp. SHJSY1]|uniref:DUF488 domain-containing protein n=1 Tax=Clostridium sp. SHJSY1 TaxID=2942483 RepID=UPI002874DCE3|nr:DUF488 domain-containing protein [Clostridium sp. SHJSY1]MDS0524997.1 DUF488 domain-containing protein [Clostridium sp. SHJSY1]